MDSKLLQPSFTFQEEQMFCVNYLLIESISV